MKPIALSLVVFGLLFGGDNHAKADLILDQSFDPNSIPSSQTFLYAFMSGADVAQTFTVGLAGILSRVDVFVGLNASPGGPLLFDIRPTSITGAPIESNSTVLASLVIPAVDVQAAMGHLSVDISAFDLSVTPGERLAIVLRTSEPELRYNWFGGYPSDWYVPGDAYDRVPSRGETFDTVIAHSNGFFVGDIDLGFRTFVATPTIPEPNTLTLFVVAFLGLLCHAWRSRNPPPL